MKKTESQRGMKKWQPFNALEHYDDYINHTYIFPIENKVFLIYVQM